MYVSFISHFNPEPYHNCCEERNCQLSAVEMCRKLKDGVRRFSDVTGNITEYIFATFHFSFQSNLICTFVPGVIMKKSRYGRERIFHTLQRCLVYRTKGTCSFAQRKCKLFHGVNTSCWNKVMFLVIFFGKKFKFLLLSLLK